MLILCYRATFILQSLKLLFLLRNIVKSHALDTLVSICKMCRMHASANMPPTLTWRAADKKN